MKYLLVILFLFVLTACGEPTEKEIKATIIKELKDDKFFTNDFIKYFKVKYGNGTLIVYNPCRKMYLEYLKKHKNEKETLLNIANNIFIRAQNYENDCNEEVEKIAKIAKTIDGIRDVEISY